MSLCNGFAGSVCASRECAMTGDWVARYGGEELCVVMLDICAEDARNALERLRIAIAEEPFRTTADAPLDITVSIGAAVRTEEDESVAALMERVSQQLLSAKRNGRNRMFFSS